MKTYMCIYLDEFGELLQEEVIAANKADARDLMQRFYPGIITNKAKIKCTIIKEKKL